MRVLVGDERLTHFCPASDDLHETGGKMVERLHHREQRERREFRRFHDDSVASGECRGCLPAKEQHGEIERHDRHDGAERLFQHHVHLPGQCGPGDTTLFVARNLCVITERRSRRTALPVRLAERFAHLAREHFTRRASHRQHAVGDLVERVRAIKRAHRPPFTLGARGSSERLVDFVGRGVRELCDRLARGGVDDRGSLS